jgi:hypothetical protein
LQGLARELFIGDVGGVLRGVPLFQEFVGGFLAVEEDVVEGLARGLCRGARGWMLPSC